MVRFDETDSGQRIDALRKLEEERLIEMLSKRYNLPYLRITPELIEIEAVPLLPERLARGAFVAVYSKPSKKGLGVGVFSPNNPKTQEVLQKLTEQGYTPIVSMVSRASLETVWERYREISLAKQSDAGVLDVTNDDVSTLMEGVTTTEQIAGKIEDLKKLKKTHNLSNIFEMILSGAFAVHSSDIHMEPQEDGVRIRYRIDGVLQDVAYVDHELYRRISTRIKLLSGLKLNIQKDTQDGRFSIRFKNDDVEIRTSVLPGQHGESIVLRILDPKSISVPLEDLGINPHLLAILKKEIEKPTGMILTTGPTGAGKTTTLYAFLRKVLDPDIKIITIEDPIEYHIKDIVQTQTDPDTNYTFLSGLRAALRQDPDIIMVGEIRDGETAKIAINAALTGHLVLSSLHTNNAAGTIPRLIDLGVNPKVLAAALNVAMAQRLVRKLCSQCKIQEPITEYELGRIKTSIERINIKQPEQPVSLPTHLWKASESGCEKCNASGYSGRIGIYEAILMDSAIESILDTNPSEKDFVEAALPQGILSLKEDGIVKVLEGVTSLDELGRVVDIEAEN